MRGGKARLELGLLALQLVLLASCGAPPARRTLDELYARRPDLSGADPSVLRGRRILIDPGHGGSFAGSQGLEQTREADVNLGVALHLWGLLHDAGADVHLTRASDRDLLPAGSTALRDDLAARVALLDSLQPEVFLSLHHNSNAELNRERNAIETYYRLDDDGPSYDLARAVHRRLAQSLGIQEARLLPGNYFVLRNASTAAVLGEASYLSNPDVESRLQLAEKQRLEAEAYFLGLLDYFAKGVPRIARLAPAADTLRAGESLRLRLEADRGAALDPLSVELLVDGEPHPLWFDAASGEAVLTADAGLPAGAHSFEVRVRNLHGHAARAWRQSLVVFAPPARVLVHQEPDPAPPGSDVRLRLRILDAWNRSVADGLPVHVEPQRLEILQREERTRSGEILVMGRLPVQGTARCRVRADRLDFDFGIQVASGAAPRRLVRCVAQGAGEAVGEFRASCAAHGDVLGDRAGCALVDARCDSLRIDRAGYVTWSGVVPRTGTVQMAAALAGHLLGRRFVVDPGGDGNEASEPDLGLSAAELAYDVARHLASFLAAAGAEAKLARGPNEQVPDLERARLAAVARAERYVRIEATLAPERLAAVLHYPGSVDGERLARALGRWLERRGGGTVAVRAETRTVLQQTPCPAVIVQLAGPRSASERLTLAHPDSVRHIAYALLLGVRAGLTPSIEAWPALEGQVEPWAPGWPGLVVLDGVDALSPAANGSFRFECVAPGEHWLTLLTSAGVHERRVQVGASTTLQLRLPGPGAQP